MGQEVAVLPYIGQPGRGDVVAWPEGEARSHFLEHNVHLQPTCS
ncbi:hypothetical protein VULLAG_LOCUS9301 [Vulpes lagopus]